MYIYIKLVGKNFKVLFIRKCGYVRQVLDLSPSVFRSFFSQSILPSYFHAVSSYYLFLFIFTAFKTYWHLTLKTNKRQWVCFCSTNFCSAPLCRAPFCRVRFCLTIFCHALLGLVYL